MVKYWKVQKYQLSYCTLQYYAIIEPKKHKNIQFTEMQK